MITALAWPRDAQRAYIAGLLDGEGYIGVKRRLPTPANRMLSPKYAVCVSVAMTDREPVEFVAAFSGAPELVKPRLRRSHFKTIYQLDLENARAIALLEDVSEFLVCKRARAIHALRLATLRASSRAHRTRVVPNDGITGSALALSDEFNEECDRIYTALLVGSPRSGQSGRWGARTC